MSGDRVLIVDDDPEICEIVQTNLEGAGYAVVEARDGAEGLRKFRAEVPDLVILDVLMPEMDGWEVLRQLEMDRQRAAGLPVIMLTCVSEDGEILRGLEAGAVEYLTKPFDPRNLVASVKILLDIFDQPGLRQARRRQLIARRRRLMGVDQPSFTFGTPSTID